MAQKLSRSNMRDAVLAASFMFFKVKGIILPSDIAKIFGFDDGTVRYIILNHPEYFIVIKRSRIIAEPAPLLLAIGPNLVQYYGSALLQRVDFKLSRLIAIYEEDLHKIKPQLEELICLARSVAQHWRNMLFEQNRKR
jgi:hypothetical protein